MRQRTWLVSISIIIASLVLAGLSFLLPSLGETDSTPVHTRMGVALVGAVLCASGAIWFMSGLRSFKAGLRLAYRLLAVGIILFGVSLAQLPVVGLFDGWSSFYANSGALVVPFIVAAVLIYAGMRRFAKLMQLQTKATSFLFVAGVSIGFALMSAVAGHYLVMYPFEGVETFTATVGLAGVFLLFAAMLAFRLHKVIGTDYKDAVRWLKFTLVAYTAAAWHEYTINFFLPVDSPYLTYGPSFLTFVIGGVLLVEASRRFYLLTASTTPASTPEAQFLTLGNRDYIDSIVNIAGLASRPEEIDSQLDNLRQITAQLDTGRALSEVEKQQLLSTYREVEDYLVTHEPLRNFTLEDVRLRATPAFRTLLAPENGVNSIPSIQP